jgi:hypothetical protein
LLANLGIGIFNGVNFAVVGPGRFERIDPRQDGLQSNKGMGTHTAVWEALRAWAASTATAAAFLDLVRIQSASLRTCLEAIWPGVAVTSSASQLISAWGIDLRRGLDEHRFRNISSYAPQALNPVSINVNDAIAFIEHVWSLFEPSVGPNFDQLDRHLLRSAMWKQHEIMDLNTPKSNGPIKLKYGDLPAAITNIAAREFLTGETEPKEPLVLKLARSTQSPSSPMEMMSRALLLLRTATSFTHANLTAAGVRCSDGALRPWLDEIAVARGFWSPRNPLKDPVDLWADVQIALENLRTTAKQPLSSLSEWLQQPDKGLPVLTEIERVGVWSFAG